jgi:DNA-binding transcriptional ArsR family regulator
MVKSSAARLDTVFHALADPTRRSILRRLARGEGTVGEIAKPYPVSLAAISKHLNVLEAASLIAREKRGSFQVVRLEPRALRDARSWLDFYEKFWTEKLDVLKTMLEEQEDV